MSKEISVEIDLIDKHTAKIKCPYCEEGLIIESHAWTHCKNCGKLFTLKQRSWIEVEE